MLFYTDTDFFSAEHKAMYNEVCTDMVTKDIDPVIRIKDMNVHTYRRALHGHWLFNAGHKTMYNEILHWFDYKR